MPDKTHDPDAYATVRKEQSLDRQIAQRAMNNWTSKATAYSVTYANVRRVDFVCTSRSTLIRKPADRKDAERESKAVDNAG